MNIAVVTLFPAMLAAVTDYGVSGRAVQRGLLRVRVFNPRDFADNRYRSVDDRPYGGGPGMVMQAPPLCEAVAAARQWLAEVDPETPAHVVYMSPQGQRLDQAGVARLSQRRNLVLVAGRYEGVDERFIELAVDEECSIGDYVVSGGELPAMVLMDALARLEPEALGHADSAAEDSFAAGLLDCPHYTRPEEYAGLRVPAVLLSGDHAQIATWRRAQALERTRLRRPDLLGGSEQDGK